jgi:hypothetical protein
MRRVRGVNGGRRPVVLGAFVVTAVLAVGAPAGAVDGGDAEPVAPPPSSVVESASFVPITPCRVVDTRQSIFGSPIFTDEEPTFFVRGAGLDFQGGETGGCGIPDSAVAIEATATAIDASGNGFLRVWAFGDAVPNATFLNYGPGRNITNTGTFPIRTPVDDFPDMQARNYGATAHFTFDINGYYVPGGPGTFTAVEPCRILDTRASVDPFYGSRFGPGDELLVRVRDPLATPAVDVEELLNQGGSDLFCDIPEGATSVELAITAVDPEGTGFVRLWPYDELDDYPNSGTMVNYSPGAPLTNTGTVEINPSAEYELNIRNLGGFTDVIIDVFGYHATFGDSYTSLSPCRVVDTRRTTDWGTDDPESFDPIWSPFVSSTRLFDGDEFPVQVSGADDLIPAPGLTGDELSIFESQGGTLGGCGVPADASAVEVSVTWTQPTGRGFLRLFPATFAAPKATFLNYSGGRSVTNTGTIQLPNDGELTDWVAANFGGDGFLIIDVQGYFRFDLEAVPF